MYAAAGLRPPTGRKGLTCPVEGDRLEDIALTRRRGGSRTPVRPRLETTPTRSLLQEASTSLRRRTTRLRRQARSGAPSRNLRVVRRRRAHSIRRGDGHTASFTGPLKLQVRVPADRTVVASGIYASLAAPPSLAARTGGRGPQQPLSGARSARPGSYLSGTWPLRVRGAQGVLGGSAPSLSNGQGPNPRSPVLVRVAVWPACLPSNCTCPRTPTPTPCSVVIPSHYFSACCY